MDEESVQIIQSKIRDLSSQTAQDRAPLWEAMQWHVTRNISPFDVPGHKRGDYIEGLTDFIGRETIRYDVNSMPGLDNLNHPEGVIDEAQMLMAKAFGAEHAFFMVGGTTQSVQAMVLSVCSPGDKIIMPRNVHKSAINALILADAIPVYMQAEVNMQMQFATGVSLATAKETIDAHPDAKAILLINPTYYGACSPLAEITAYAQEKGLVVLVDEAHGAHFEFHEQLPPSAMSCGADMAAVSIHKTGGALTQASALFLQNDRVTHMHVQKVIHLTQTTSASYLLMTSLDIARRHLARNGRAQLDKVLQMVREAKIQLNQIPGIYAYGEELVGTAGVTAIDETKLGICVAGLGITGFAVYEQLHRDFNIQMELADTHNVLAIVSLGDTEEHLQKLVAAMHAIAKQAVGKIETKDIRVPNINPRFKATPRQAFYAVKKAVVLEQAEGCTSAESIMVYPPGIPILTPGEEITAEVIAYIQFLKTQSSQLTDMNDPTLESLLVVAEEIK